MTTRVLLILLVSASVARADKAGAKTHLDAGIAAYRASDFETASRELEAAYGLDPDPKTLYAWAQARRQGGHCDLAVPLYEKYIALAPGEANVAAARTGISMCEQATPPPVENKPAAPPPTPTSPEPAEPSRWYEDTLGDTLAVTGVVGIGVGVTFMVLAKSSEDAANAATERDQFVDSLGQATLRWRVGFACAGVGAALVISGIVRYATRSTEPAHVAFTLTNRSIGIVGRF